MKKLALVILLVGSILFSYEYILTSYAKFFHINSYSKGADAILVLSGGSGNRVDRAIELLQSGYSKRILLTQEIENKRKYDFIPTSMDIKKKILAHHNITNYHMIPSLKGGATSTFDEAYDLVKYLEKNNLNHIIIVTSDFHTKRAKYAFDKVLKANNLLDKIKVEMASSKSGVHKDNNWWKYESGLKTYPIEGMKFLVYLFRYKNISSIQEE
jgi:uncharacterized SAM-binding protein YcdF (DUF218 family)